MKRAAPERTCVGCRTARSKAALVRIVLTPDGSIALDLSGKMPGRGAYVCPDPVCLETAVRRRALERALKVGVPPEVVEQLRAGVAPDAADPPRG